MNHSLSTASELGRTFIVLSIFFVIAVAATCLPLARKTSASGIAARTNDGRSEFQNYDIRGDKSSFERRMEYRASSGRSGVDNAELRDRIVNGENELRRSVHSLQVEYSELTYLPEIIGTDVARGRAFLSGPNKISDGKNGNILRQHLSDNYELYRITASEIDSLTTAADYTNPDGNLSFVTLSQSIDGIPVFQGEVRTALTKRGEIVRVINNLLPEVSASSVSSHFGTARDAVKYAAEHIKYDPTNILSNNVADVSGKSNKVAFGEDKFATTAEKLYFPIEAGVAIPAWKVLFWLQNDTYYVIVDANDGTLLWRKNLVEHQTQSATYRIWANPNALINVGDSPNPYTPGPTSPNGAQAFRADRSSITRIGNEPPYTFNNLGWITDGANTTEGNAVEAGVDRDNPNGIDVNGKPVPPTNRIFDFAINPGNPSGVPDFGEAPLPAGQLPGTCNSTGNAPALIEYQKASVTQLFYITNWFHDETYRLGFTEQAGNFQNDNFGRGGIANDRISAEAQDCTGSNGGNFATLTDGNPGRMQMFIWTGPTPDFDGALDADVAIHELTHGLSNRLHGNASGLSINMSRGMGEGWSDFYAKALLSDPNEPLEGIFTIGGYLTNQAFNGYNTNYYYGIRRFPLAVRSYRFEDRPHNPLTFADVDQTQLNVNDGAFGRGPFGSTTADQVHNLGEIWSSMLWEVRARLIARLGWQVGNRKALQLVTDGMKLSPLGPNFLNSRDAILAAAQASSVAPEAAADVADVWAGFAVRGLGLSASIQNVGTGSGNARVTEAFNSPNLTQAPNFTVSDPIGFPNGYPDIGETVTLNIPLSNFTGNTATNVTLQIPGNGSANYGTISNGATVIMPVNYTVPANATCGSTIELQFNVNSSLGPVTFTRPLVVGSPVVAATQNFDTVMAPSIPANWFSTSINNGVSFVTVSDVSQSSPNSAFALNPDTVGGGTDLTSEIFNITSPSAEVSFRHRYLTEAGWDGAVLEITIGNGGIWNDIVTAGGSFKQNGYNGSLANGTNNPLANRPAWQGNSNGWITTVASLPPAAAGQIIRLRWRFGADNNTAPANGGWHIDNIQVVGSYQCVIVDNFGKARADFDGDDRTDISVWRPSDRVWHMLRSTTGYTSAQFGLSTDIPTPGDFDGDLKADIAVWRPSDGNWYRLNSSTGTFVVLPFGTNGDIPVAGDRDADGRDDIVIWRPSSGVWYWQNSSNGSIGIAQFGSNGDMPLTGDYDGDGRVDIAVWRPSTGIWYRINSSNDQFNAFQFGISSDVPVPGDYDGDLRTDIAVFRPSDGTWYRQNSSNGQYVIVPFGLNGDVPTPGDYDGDGKEDIAVYRSGIWYLNRSTAGFSALQFGLAVDIPIPKVATH
ncbi:MAG: M36 family metallopeptidase [Blastocatellia bacterium]|nr:M36 family metallopeptidase [Blastocatellia bacterium]